MSQPIEKKYRYPGVTPFSTEQADVFFGRKQDTDELYRLIKRESLIILYGKSGLGKSSLINAGVVPEVQKDKVYNPIIIRFGAWTEDSTQSPLEVIKNALRTSKVETILSRLIQYDNSLWKHAKEMQLKNEGKPLLIFDQFEELFSYPEQQINEFQQEVAELINTDIPLRFRRALDKIEEISDKEEDVLELPLEARIVFAIRSDRMHLLDRLTTYLPNVLRNCFELRALKGEDAKNAIVAPAQAKGDFVTLPFQYSEDAVANMLRFLEDGLELRVEGILLQMLCEYYERKHVEKQGKKILDLLDIGDPNEVVKNYYEDKIQSLKESEREAVHLLIEEGLVSEGEAMRLTLHEAYIIQEYGVDKPLLEKLVNIRLLRSEPFLRGGYTYELCHDRLVTAVLESKKKRIEEEEKLRIEKENERVWKEKEQQRKIEEDKKLLEIERRGRIKAKKLSIIGFVFASLAVFAAIFAFQQSKSAQKARIEAELESQKAQIQEKLATDSKIRAEKERLIADSLSLKALNQMKIIEANRVEIEKQKNKALNTLRELQIQIEENKKLQETNQQYEDLLKQLRPNRYKQIKN